MPEKDAADIIRAVVSAVYYMHKNDLIHMDLKPENILFKNQEGLTVKLIDFHFAQSTLGCEEVPMIGKPLPSAEPGKAFGTPYYIAPEVLTGNYDAKCDMWSIGCILFTLLTGLPPF